VVSEGVLSVMYWVLVLLEQCCFIILEVVMQLADTIQMVNSTQVVSHSIRKKKVVSHSQLLDVPWEIHGGIQWDILFLQKF
jgi:hypothetical protein